MIMLIPMSLCFLARAAACAEALITGYGWVAGADGSCGWFGSGLGPSGVGGSTGCIGLELMVATGLFAKDCASSCGVCATACDESNPGVAAGLGVCVAGCASEGIGYTPAMAAGFGDSGAGGVAVAAGSNSGVELGAGGVAGLELGVGPAAFPGFCGSM